MSSSPPSSKRPWNQLLLRSDSLRLSLAFFVTGLIFSCFMVLFVQFPQNEEPAMAPHHQLSVRFSNKRLPPQDPPAPHSANSPQIQEPQNRPQPSPMGQASTKAPEVPGIDTSARPEDPSEIDTYFQAVRKLVEERKQYPLAARKYRVQGKVRLHFTLSAEGNLLSSAIDSCGHRILDEAALNALYGIKNFPQSPDGQQKDFQIDVVFQIMS